MTTSTRRIHVYTDGACSGNPGPMGIGCVIFDEGDSYDPGRVEVSEFLGDGTNQRAELLAVDAGLLYVLRRQGSALANKIIVYSDSEYAIGLLSKGWRAKANQELVAAVRKTCARFGSRLRASVDDQRVAAGLGINVNIVFLSTFAFGCGLAGLGGALGAEVLGLDPNFPLKFMFYFLIVCAVGGTSSITGPLLAALLVGIADVAGKYYIPKLGAFIVYTVMIAILIWKPQGLFVRQGGKA